MTKYIVEGGRPLFGEIQISGAKNAAVAIIPAALMVGGVCRIENIPQISDVELLLGILRDLGANIRFINPHAVEIDSTKLRNGRVPYESARRCRASYYMLGALLGRFGCADVALPGGCDFGGTRPIDQHLKGFRALGASVDTQSGFVLTEAEDGRLKGANIFLDKVSVGATINIMLAAALADGMTVIENVAKEPHIVDVANFLNSMGADIMGAGTDVIKIRGVDSLHGGTYSIIPDQIEAGTYMAAVAACGGEVKLCNIIPKHMDCITAKMQEMGVEIQEMDDNLVVSRIGKLTKTNIKTMPYPGFPTDMQPQIAAALCLARGTSIITDSVWNSRFRYTDEFKRMGAQIQVDGNLAIIEGVDHLTGAQLEACDLRAGAAMLIAALAAHGVSEITNVQYIERGYEDIIGKIRGVGGMIYAVEVPEEDESVVSNVG
ncbi:MAG: UDP-N-acetylglucosamine 1-carboxyvinyltransferase [Oscillospiraceae bacterium]|nr:UDP-N-acetylglucosamine 1-carboxyvinyltransferase [Oscillospiraceae bacterium]